ncbi:MAG: hypothetical protein JXR96_00850 [Deltaproteobacteria bacterium]|nr:hypothetical protein [Deltaproteobacteria bacterium]
MRARLAELATVLAIAACPACEEHYQRGNCDPGFLEVDGECIRAVGTDCEEGCISGICVEDEDGTRFCTIDCETHEDCPVSYFCDAERDMRCYPGQRPPPCVSDADCEPCERCTDGECRAQTACVICASDEDCQTCQRCSDQECIDVAGCVACTDDSQCPTCQICSQSGVCVRLPSCVRCTSDLDCPGCMECDRGACVPIEGCGEDPCFNDTDCPLRTRCLYNASANQRTCLPVDLGFGEECGRGGSPMCASGICIYDEVERHSLCSLTCVSDEDCPDETVCQPDESCLWACRTFSPVQPGEDCLRSLDCEPDRLCSVLPSQDGTSWRARCIDPWPCALDDGQPCSPQDRCRTGICSLDGFCTPVCASDSDCPSLFGCTRFGLPLPGGPEADLLACRPIQLMGLELGEPCTPDGCRQGFCLEPAQTWPHAFCAQTCRPESADCPDRYACLETPDGEWACQPAMPGGECDRDADCGQGEVCAAAEPGARLLQCAITATGSAAPGEPCSATGDCQHGICTLRGRCASACLDSQDCPAPLVCDLDMLWTAGGGPVHARLCVDEPGSLDVCRRDADCPAGELCMPEPGPWDGGVRARCRTSREGAGPGEACGSAADCANAFCTPRDRCSTACASDADCPEGLACVALEARFADGALWTAGCVPSGRGLGEACPDGDVNCTSGICLVEPISGIDYCSQACLTDEDCPVLGMSCIGQGGGQGSLCEWLF